MRIVAASSLPFTTLASLALFAPSVEAVGSGPESYAPRIGDWGLDLAGVDETVRPQDDFFRHANGAWLREFEIPEDLSVYGSFTQLFLDAEEQVREIIEESARIDAPMGTTAQQVGDFYSDFLDVEEIEARGLEPLAGDLERIRAVRTHEDVAVLLAELDRVGGTTPFNYYIDQDPKDPSRYLVQFVQSGLGLPNRDYYLVEDNPRFAAAREAYSPYLEKMLGFVGAEAPAASGAAIFALEKRLAEAHWPSEETRDRDRTYNLMTAEEIATLAPEFPWATYLRHLGVAGESEFLVRMPSAYAGMAVAFAETPVEVWKSYLTYRLLRNSANCLPREIDRTHFEFSSALSGAREQRERWKRGVQIVNATMGEAVGQLYAAGAHFPETSKERMEELVDNLIAAFDVRIGELDWMGPETKKQAREKLSKFTVKIGYPDEWRDYSDLEVVPGDLLGNVRRAIAFESDYQLAKLGGPVDRNEWGMTPQTVNAYYNPGLNEIVFPAAILQPPFFDPNADDAVNYGAIGAVIGHEIGHGFDDQGRKSDGDGVLRDWWTESDASRFQERSDALVVQYDGYSPIEGMNVNGRLTLGENIGDVGGLEIAHHAYRLSLKGEPAPVLDDYTGDQRFFLGFSQIWRGKVRDELMTQLLASDPHSPMEFRVNGTLRNIDAWYEAFDVGPGDAMYLEPGKTRPHLVAGELSSRDEREDPANSHDGRRGGSGPRGGLALGRDPAARVLAAEVGGNGRDVRAGPRSRLPASRGLRERDPDPGVPDRDPHRCRGLPDSGRRRAVLSRRASTARHRGLLHVRGGRERGGGLSGPTGGAARRGRSHLVRPQRGGGGLRAAADVEALDHTAGGLGSRDRRPCLLRGERSRGSAAGDVPHATRRPQRADVRSPPAALPTGPALPADPLASLLLPARLALRPLPSEWSRLGRAVPGAGEPGRVAGAQPGGSGGRRVGRLSGRSGDWAAANEVRYLVVLVPAKHQVEEEAWGQYRRLWKLAPEDFDRDHPQRVVGEYLEGIGVDTLDLLEECRAAASSGRSLYFPVDRHWTAEGHSPGRRLDRAGARATRLDRIAEGLRFATAVRAQRCQGLPPNSATGANHPPSIANAYIAMV